MYEAINIRLEGAKGPTMQHYPFLGQLDNRMGASAGAAPLSATAFVMCPAACLMGWPTHAMMWRVYQMAYEQAQAVVRPSRLEILERATVN
jgi:hypothetical protein